MTGNEKDRLEIIEEKIDKIGDILVEIARTDIRINSIERYVERKESHCESREKRIREVELLCSQNTQSLKNIIKLGYIIITAVVGNIIFAIIGG